MICYIAGPYSASTQEGVQANIDAAEAIGKQMLLHGYTPVIPHRITGHWETDPQFAHIKYDEWMRMCIKLLDKCDVIAMVPGWQKSKGAVIEHQHASLRGKTIIYHAANKCAA